LMTWYSLTLYFYIDKKQSFFNAFKHALYTITNNFWNIVGAGLCMMIITYVLNMVVAIIPYFIVMFGVIFGLENNQNIDNIGTGTISIISVVVVIIYCISLLVSMILGHLLLIQTGLVYYSEREKLEYNTMRQSIDEIGKYE